MPYAPAGLVRNSRNAAQMHRAKSHQLNVPITIVGSSYTTTTSSTVGYKGNTFIDQGYFYAPYMPLNPIQQWNSVVFCEFTVPNYSTDLGVVADIVGVGRLDGNNIIIGEELFDPSIKPLICVRLTMGADDVQYLNYPWYKVATDGESYWTTDTSYELSTTDRDTINAAIAKWSNECID